MTAVIPAYQPGETLTDVARQLCESGIAVLIVDDGSGPAYNDIFGAAGKYGEVISYNTNCGKGHALKTAFRRLSETGVNGVIVTLDSDGQHKVCDVIRVAEHSERHKNALTLGARSLGKNAPLRSRFGNAATRVVYRVASGINVSDTQTGLRAFDSSLLQFMLGIDGDRYEYEMNMLMECPRRKIQVDEVPIETVYIQNNRGSHFRTVSDSLLVYGGIFKFALSSFAGFVTDYILYSIFIFVLGGLGTAIAIPVSNVSARIISAGTNFALNKRFVFKNKDSVVKTGAQYFILAACILAGNTVLLSFMVNTLGINKYAAKLVTELTFFTLSWLAQRFIIFRNCKCVKKRRES